MAGRKTVAGHRFGGMNFGVSASCECGWRSAMWFGKGARTAACDEWNEHIRYCLREAENSA